MPEISEGAIIDYKIRTIQNQLINNEDFDLAYSLKENEPVIHARFSLDIPKGRDLKIKVLNPGYNSQNIDLSPKINETAGGGIISGNLKTSPDRAGAGYASGSRN